MKCKPSPSEICTNELTDAQFKQLPVKMVEKYLKEKIPHYMEEINEAEADCSSIHCNTTIFPSNSGNG